MSNGPQAEIRRSQLARLWEQHCNAEFSKKDAGGTIETMGANPYVNHVPTLTGGSGKDELQRFYRDHFIACLPDDTATRTVSQTIDHDRLVEELIFCFTHDREIDFLLPGVPPTGKYVEIPTVVIVTFDADKIVSEHIYWDQASVLVQIGLLTADGLPIGGVETARKVEDRTVPFRSLPARHR